MARNMTLIAVFVATFALVSAIGAQPAAADESVDAYRVAMGDLLALTDEWHKDLTVHVGAISVKPQLACTAEFVEQVQQGVWLADDLRGSAESAPEQIRDANLQAAEAFELMLAGAESIGRNCEGTNLNYGKQQIDAGFVDYAKYTSPVRTFVRIGNDVGGEQPVPVLPKLTKPAIGGAMPSPLPATVNG